MGGATMSIRAACRACGDWKRCEDWTLHTRDIVAHDEGVQASDCEGPTTGLCADCLDTYGADDDCGDPPDDPRTAAEVNGETELELMREWGDF